MKKQNDWFTGIDYYEQYQEKDIDVTFMTIEHEIELHRHVQVELWYVVAGEATIMVNGVTYTLHPDSFLCLYAHHLYAVHHIQQPIKVYIARFYIGVFLHMMWEKHNKGINAQLVYDTCPHLINQNEDVKNCMLRLYQEHEQKQFGSKNMMLYLVLELHTFHCRMALSQTNDFQQDLIWKYIKCILVSSQIPYTLDEIAKESGYHPQYLNQLVKEKSGYTFHDLLQFGKVINACALLHFEELSVAYIADLLHFESKASFYRVFEKYTGKTPSDYRRDRILTKDYAAEQDLYLQIQQYLHLHFFQKISIKQLADALHVKPYMIEHLLYEEYHTTLAKELLHIRIQYACALLKGTDMSMTQIAMECGFESISSFQRNFKKGKGTTPTNYRNLSK